jgi:hypothetical protein
VRTPDLTPAQIIALIGAAITLASVFGLAITPEQREAILAFVGVLLSVFIHADAKIRHGRATGRPTPPAPSSSSSDAPTEPGA